MPPKPAREDHPLDRAIWVTFTRVSDLKQSQDVATILFLILLVKSWYVKCNGYNEKTVRAVNEEAEYVETRRNRVNNRDGRDVYRLRS